MGRRLGLSAVDHRALTLVMRNAPLTASTLAKLTGLTPGAVTGLVDRLENAGYVRRVPDQADRRRVLISPVFGRDSGLSEAFAGLSEAMAAMMAKYDEHELAVIGDYVRNTIEVLHEQTRRLTGQ